MLIRNETAQDQTAVYELLTAAFDTSVEAELVNRLRASANPLISLVAELDGKLVGHILFSPVTLDSYTTLSIMGLAPVAVTPLSQRQGIGSALILAGLEKCRELNVGAVCLLGHPEYYPRFGFTPSIQLGIKSEYDAPAEAFMILQLIPDYLLGKKGTIRYHPAFT